MAARWNTFCLPALSAMLMALLSAAASPTSSTPLVRQLQETIAKVRASDSPTVRREAAEQLPQLTRGLDPKEVDDKTLAQLVSLLDTWDDSVRLPVATSLGNLGSRARVAAPQLLEILPEVDCLWAEVSPAPIIRDALRRMGAAEPPRPNCESKIEPVVWRQRIIDDIAKVRTSDSPVIRAKAAIHLNYLTFWLPSIQLDDKTVADLVSLLDVREEPVREGVTAAIGNLGGRAKVAVPKLQELLAEVDCHEASAVSASNIRIALSQMHVKTPRPRCAGQGKNPL